MRRRVDLAASLVGRPEVLFLDEPTTGLDPQGRSDVWDTVRMLVSDGVTVLLTTQYLDEADQLAHDIVVIDHGKVIATGTPDELKAKVGGQVLEVEPAERGRLADVAAVLARWTGGEPVADPDGKQVTAQVATAAVLPDIVRQLDENGIQLAQFSLRKSSLDEVFLTLTGHRAEDETAMAGEDPAPAGLVRAEEQRVEYRNADRPGAGRARSPAQPTGRRPAFTNPDVAQRSEDQDEFRGPARPEPAADHVLAAVHVRVRRRDRARQRE